MSPLMAGNVTGLLADLPPGSSAAVSSYGLKIDDMAGAKPASSGFPMHLSVSCAHAMAQTAPYPGYHTPASPTHTAITTHHHLVCMPAGMVVPKGYPLEQHVVITNDGYKLGTFRIPYGR